MRRNVGGLDRAVRIAAGLALLVWVLLGDGAVRWWGLLGLPLLASGIFRFCPAYLPFGFRSDTES